MKKRLIIPIILLIIFTSTLIYSSFKLITWRKENKETSNTINIVRSIAEPILKDDNTISINFEKLKEENNEVVGWIRINNTNIDYPVVKHSDNDYYLNHSFDNTYNGAGWIFMNYLNDSNLNDQNTIVFGHDRKDKSMFGSLRNTLESEWLDNSDNLIIDYLTLEKHYKFKIFSVYNIANTSDYLSSYFDQDMINTVINRSYYKFNEEVNIDDKILTLQTCYNDSKKIIVHAKLID